jgi:alpha-tubulin suppressor-like RCC1 family protein
MLCWTFAVASLALTACRDSSTAPPPPEGGPPRSPTLSIANDATLLVDEVFPVTVTALDTLGRPIVSPSITWRSSAPSVASVHGWGHVEALALGSAVITATMDSLEARATITVVPQFTQIATGELHTCGITGRGEVYCWGESARGEVGHDSVLQDCSEHYGPGSMCSPAPVRSSNLHAVAIAAGLMHSWAIDESGTAFCWGANVYGELGNGGESDASEPMPVSSEHRFTQIVAGRMHSCGITTSHDAYCWGWDDSGQLGAGNVSAQRCTYFGTNPCSRTPRLVVGAHQWARLSATERATCGVTTTGELYCWGLGVGGSDGLYCQTPDNLVNCTRTPTLIASPKGYAATGIGDVHRCEQALDGTLDCWGTNFFGVFGDGTRETYSPTPVIAAGGTAYASFVSTRLGALCALTGDGRAQCWGRGGEGEIGNGLFEDALTPTDVSGGHRFAALASSGSSDYVCGIVTDTGRAYCWGLGANAQLGDGEFQSRSEPVLVRLVR